MNYYDLLTVLIPNCNLRRSSFLNLGLILFHRLNRKKEGIFHLNKTLELNPELEGSDKIRNTIAAYEKSLRTAQPEGINEASEK